MSLQHNPVIYPKKVSGSQNNLKKILLVMKLTIFLILVAFFQVRAEGYAQNVTLSANKISMEKLFNQVKKQTGYIFFYDKALLKNARPVSIHVKNAPLDKVLDISFKDQPLSYKIIGQTIVVRNRLVVHSEESIKIKDESLEQEDVIEKVIRGKVTDEEGNPLAGVSVSVKGTQVGTTTNEEGRYSLSVSDNARMLVFSMVGFAEVESEIPLDLVLNISLDRQIGDMGEVVITGYFDQSKTTFTGAATSFTGEDVKTVSNQNVLSALSVLDPSFKLIDNNIVGSNPNELPEFQIRGAGSIQSPLEERYTGNPNLPIFMLNGFEVSMDKIYDLDPERVLNITILKDAAALAIYGSRGANGVVVINTTQPKGGKLNATYKVDMNIDVADLSSYNLLQSADKLEYERLAGIYSPNSYILSGESYSHYYNERLKLVQAGINTDWLAKPVKRAGTSTKHSLGFDGGNDAFQYGMNLYYNPTNGVMKGSKRERSGIELQLFYNYNNLKFSNLTSFDHVIAKNSPYGDFSTYAYLNPYYDTYGENGNIKKVLYELASPQLPTTLIANPMYNATINTKDENKYDNFTNNFGMEWKVRSGLKVDLKFSLSKKNQTIDIFKPADHTDFINSEKKGSYQKVSTESFQYEGIVGLNFMKNINKHLLVLNANYNIKEVNENSYSVMASGFPNDLMDHIGMGLEYIEGSKPQGYETTTRLMGFLSNANYSFDNRFLADISVRYDGSSQFGSKQRWGMFWSSGLGWNLHEEPFVKEILNVDVLRIRGSIGFTGAQNFYPYQSLMMYQYQTSMTYDDLFGATVNSFGNDDLKWQRTLKKNIGIDFEFFKNKVSGYINFYNDVSKDVLVDVSMAPSLGFDTYKANLGEVSNNGIEAFLKLTLFSDQEKKQYFNVFGTAMKNKNKLLKISNALQAYNDKVDGTISNKPVVRYVEGRSLNTIWVVPSLGIDPATGEEVFLNKDDEKVNVWDASDYVPYAFTDPKVEGNFGSNVGYKNFQLSIYFLYRMGGYLYNTTLVNRIENVDPNRNVDKRVFYNRWKEPGDNQGYKSITDRSLTQPTSRFVEKDNRLELKSINLSYFLPNKEWLSKLGIERARVSAYLNDVFQINSVKTERGISYPFSRHYALSLQLNF